MRTDISYNRNFAFSADGKAVSLDELIRIANEMARWFASKRGHSLSEEDVEDLAGQAIADAYEHIGKYDSSRSPLRTWIGTIVFNAGCDMIRKQVHNAETRHALADNHRHCGVHYAPDIESEYDEKCLRRDMGRYFKSLDSRNYRIMRMYSDGYKSGEIARELGLTEASVYGVVCREKKRLANEIVLRRA